VRPEYELGKAKAVEGSMGRCRYSALLNSPAWHTTNPAELAGV
jgi:hypothetical protein